MLGNLAEYKERLKDFAWSIIDLGGKHVDLT
jgi:hypothetical protein